MGKVGVIDVGGGFRCVYTAGVLDYCMDHDLVFDTGIGVSAGSANIMAYIAGQRGRNLRFYTDYALRKECTSFRNLVTKRSYLDLNYLYGTLSNSDGEYALDYEAFMRNPMEFVVVATEAETGEPAYFHKEDIPKDQYDVIKASCAIPVLCHPYAVGEELYYDGALGDSVPIQKAFEMGCDKVVLLLTKPKDTVRTSDQDRRLARILRRRYPRSAKRLAGRARRYNVAMARARELEKKGKVLIIAPDDTCGVSTVCKDVDAMNQLYEKGYKDGEQIAAFLRQ